LKTDKPVGDVGLEIIMESFLIVALNSGLRGRWSLVLVVRETSVGSKVGFLVLVFDRSWDDCLNAGEAG